MTVPAQRQPTQLLAAGTGGPHGLGSTQGLGPDTRERLDPSSPAGWRLGQPRSPRAARLLPLAILLTPHSTDRQCPVPEVPLLES